MSGSVTVTGPITDAERVAIRRFCGYPAYGSMADGNAGWRFFGRYGNMEYRVTNLSVDECVVVRQYLGQCSVLEQAIVDASSKLGIQQAAVFVRNANEIRDRQRLFDDWRRRLCGFLGIEPGEALSGGGNSARVVV